MTLTNQNLPACAVQRGFRPQTRPRREILFQIVVRIRTVEAIPPYWNDLVRVALTKREV